MRALVDDTAALSRRANAAEVTLSGHSSQLQDTKEALIRWGLALEVRCGDGGQGGGGGGGERG